jgi:hypothetical protein
VLSDKTNAAAAGGRILNPPYPAAGESDGIYELVDSGLGFNWPSGLLSLVSIRFRVSILWSHPLRLSLVDSLI